MSPRRRDAPPGPSEAARLLDNLRGRILSGELAAGTPLREESLATTTGLSRHTVRTALARLATEKLVVQQPYRGIRVTSFTGEDVNALQQFRCALETEAVWLIHERYGSTWPESVTTPIRKAVEKLELVAKEDSNDWSFIATAHAAVHRAVITGAQSPRIAEAHAGLESEMLLLLANLQPAYSAEEVASDHRDYLELLQRDVESAVRRHLASGTEQIWPRSARGRT